MNEHPILFSTPMVQALLEGRKTMTRRIMKLQQHTQLYTCGTNKLYWSIDPNNLKAFLYKCPYGSIGDLLWVKETYYAFGHWTSFIENVKSKKKFFDLTNDYHRLHQFHADWQFDRHIKFGDLGWHKRSALFMPKTIAKRWLKITDISVELLQKITPDDAEREGIEHLGGDIWRDYSNKKSFPEFMPKTIAKRWLKITDISVERLQKITPEDAEREGIESHGGDIWKYYGTEKRFPEFMKDSTFTRTSSFKSLWQKINGDESWEANPWVWVISFNVISTTGRPNEY